MKRRKNKYGNIKTTVNGVVFDSKLEAKRWKELRLLEHAGEISNLERQVLFPLIVNDVKVATMRPDFAYTDKNGARIIEDTKSVATAKNRVYRLKKKLLKAIYGIEIVEVFR